jgi:hypothetical protein
VSSPKAGGGLDLVNVCWDAAETHDAIQHKALKYLERAMLDVQKLLNHVEEGSPLEPPELDRLSHRLRRAWNQVDALASYIFTQPLGVTRAQLQAEREKMRAGAAKAEVERAKRQGQRARDEQFGQALEREVEQRKAAVMDEAVRTLAAIPESERAVLLERVAKASKSKRKSQPTATAPGDPSGIIDFADASERLRPQPTTPGA